MTTIENIRVWGASLKKLGQFLALWWDWHGKFKDEIERRRR